MLRYHGRQHVLDRQKHAVDVFLQKVAECLVFNLPDRGLDRAGSTCCANQDVDPAAKEFPSALDQANDLCLFSNVSRRYLDTASHGAQLVSHFFKWFTGSCSQHQIGALTSQGLANGAAHSLRRTSDDYSFVC